VSSASRCGLIAQGSRFWIPNCTGCPAVWLAANPPKVRLPGKGASSPQSVRVVARSSRAGSGEFTALWERSELPPGNRSANDATALLSEEPRRARKSSGMPTLIAAALVSTTRDNVRPLSANSWPTAIIALCSRQAHLQLAEADFEPIPFDAPEARAFGRVAAALRAMAANPPLAHMTRSSRQLQSRTSFRFHLQPQRLQRNTRARAGRAAPAAPPASPGPGWPGARASRRWDDMIDRCASHTTILPTRPTSIWWTP
jgi:hypothetical protein